MEYPCTREDLLREGSRAGLDAVFMRELSHLGHVSQMSCPGDDGVEDGC
ncbi:hypothetical protein [Microbacterium trichothecenolyticum]